MLSIKLALEAQPNCSPALKEKYELLKKMITNDKRFIAMDIKEYIEKDL